MLPRIRIFCLSERNDNILMWSHYANYHTGVVLKFKIIPELDTPLSIARPVIYVPTPPFYFSATQIIEQILSIKKIETDLQKLNEHYTYIKSDVWAEEKEWRVWDIKPKNTSGWYSDYKLYPQELETIYFGCKINVEEKNKIIQVAKQFNPNMTFYQSEKCSKTYGIIFKNL